MRGKAIAAVLLQGRYFVPQGKARVINSEAGDTYGGIGDSLADAFANIIGYLTCVNSNWGYL
jgi:hypothetical protein